MSMYFGLAAVKELKKKRKKKKKKKKEKEKEKEGGRRSIVKADSRSAAASFGEMVLMEIPEEVLMEILVRLPVNSLMRFKCVSKLWYSLISCRYFTNLFFKVSSPRREGRVFMCVVDLNLINKYVLFSASSGNREASASFPKLNQDLTLPGMRGHFVNALRGLMCFRIGREVRIYNFTTRQVVSLPKVRSNMLEGDSHMWNYFGHDPVNDEYKVVSKVWSVSEELKRLRSETQVFVLGTGASWRNTRTCSSPPISHRPYSQGISINGVLYYGIWSPGKRCVMSFDLTSEDFNLIDLPVEANIIWRVSQANLMNYRGKLAVFECSRLATECILDLWVVEDAGKSKWSHKVFVLPCHQLRQSLGITDMLLIRGTSLSGKIRLSARILDGSKISKHAIYDLETNRVTQGVVIKPLYPKFFSRAASLQTTLWDDVESIMYLEA